MDSCPGGGAEIFAKRVRDIICTNKISGERWLEVARECHRQGVKTNATMLYGHVETAEERVDHLLRLRALQDETGGIPGLIPLAFHPENTPLAHLPSSTGQLDLRVIAASRLLLDNVPHIKAYWIQIGTKLAQVALFFGADDLVGTVVDETITHAAGATTASGMTRTDFERIIRESGREPYERDSEYRRVVRQRPAGRTGDGAWREPDGARSRGALGAAALLASAGCFSHDYKTEAPGRGRRRRPHRADGARGKFPSLNDPQLVPLKQHTDPPLPERKGASA